MMIWVGAFVVWLIGAVVTNAITREMGLRNPNTIYDSFSGDDGLDVAVIVFWPAFWPCYAAHWAARAFAMWALS